MHKPSPTESPKVRPWPSCCRNAQAALGKRDLAKRRAGWLSLLRLLLAAMFLGCSPVVGHAAGQPPAALATLVDHGGLMVRCGRNVLVSLHPDQPFIPASTLKIATSLAALETLGADYRFTTRFYQDRQGNLFIKGGGDPMLVSEEVALITANLRRQGLRRVRDLVLDGSLFALSGPAQGGGHSLNPYDALNAGLAVNFNTVSLLVSAGGGVRSAEPQTPTLPIMTRLGRDLPAGRQRVNITAASPADSWRYAGQLFRALLAGQRIEVDGRIRPGRVPADLSPFYTHTSTLSLGRVVAAMLRYSNNFIANQLLLTCGRRRFGPPATWDKGRRMLTEFLGSRLGLVPGSFAVVEGSGLSRRNRITPRAMLRLLEAFRPYAGLMPEDDEGRLIKSGTLEGVYAYAGYFHARDSQKRERFDSFVIFLNQNRNTRNQLLGLLTRLRDQRPTCATASQD